MGESDRRERKGKTTNQDTANWIDELLRLYLSRYKIGNFLMQIKMPLSHN
jgi:hypothetical protein